MKETSGQCELDLSCCELAVQVRKLCFCLYIYRIKMLTVLAEVPVNLRYSCRVQAIRICSFCVFSCYYDEVFYTI